MKRIICLLLICAVSTSLFAGNRRSIGEVEYVSLIREGIEDTVLATKVLVHQDLQDFTYITTPSTKTALTPYNKMLLIEGLEEAIRLSDIASTENTEIDLTKIVGQAVGRYGGKIIVYFFTVPYKDSAHVRIDFYKGYGEDIIIFETDQIRSLVGYLEESSVVQKDLIDQYKKFYYDD